MWKNDGAESASAARAARLREQIAEIERGSPDTSVPADKPDRATPLTPRDFVRRRMRELDPGK